MAWQKISEYGDDRNCIGTITGHQNIAIDDAVLTAYLVLKQEVAASAVERLKKNLRKKGCPRISIAKNLWVEDDYRGKGVGMNLMKNFLRGCKGPVVLIADTGEVQRPGFDLVSWYKKLGFIVFWNHPETPLMIRY